MNDVLVISLDSKEKVVIGFENSDGDIEYTTYVPEDGGILEGPFNGDDSLGAILATEADIMEYQDYHLDEIKGQ